MRTSTTDVRDLTAPTPRELAPLLDGRARFDEEEELGEPTLELDTPVAGARGTRPFASVELELGLAPFLERATLRRRHILLWALGGGLLLAVGLALFLTRAVVRPLDEMRELTRRVGAGDLEVRLGWRRRDVVGELSRALDAMADRLHAARDEQERPRAGLPRSPTATPSRACSTTARCTSASRRSSCGPSAIGTPSACSSSTWTPSGP